MTTKLELYTESDQIESLMLLGVFSACTIERELQVEYKPLTPFVRKSTEYHQAPILFIHSSHREGESTHEKKELFWNIVLWLDSHLWGSNLMLSNPRAYEALFSLLHECCTRHFPVLEHDLLSFPPPSPSVGASRATTILQRCFRSPRMRKKDSRDARLLHLGLKERTPSLALQSLEEILYGSSSSLPPSPLPPLHQTVLRGAISSVLAWYTSQRTVSTTRKETTNSPQSSLS
jgi:hypothetical protein